MWSTRLASPGSVEVLPHNDIGRLEQRIGELSTRHQRVWLAVDGLYSMYGDLAPIRERRGLPLVSRAESPIRYLGVGRAEVMYRLRGALRGAGYFVDVATFPAVATELPRALAAEGATRVEVAEAFAGA